MAKVLTESRYYTGAATADLTNKAGYVMALDTSNVNNIIIGNAQTTKNIGILYKEGTAKQIVTVILSSGPGTATAIYGGTVAIGDYLTADANGKLIATTTAADQVLAQAKEAGVAGEQHEVILCNFRYR